MADFFELSTLMELLDSLFVFISTSAEGSTMGHTSINIPETLESFYFSSLWGQLFSDTSSLEDKCHSEGLRLLPTYSRLFLMSERCLWSGYEEGLPWIMPL